MPLRDRSIPTIVRAMRIALVQQCATRDKAGNLDRGLRALEQAARAGADVVAVLNLFERDGDRTYDTSPVLDADGTLLGRTRMVHITDYACVHEQGNYTPGDLGAPVYDTRAGRISVAICYDRHYPEYVRALAITGADLVVVPQAPARRRDPKTMPSRPRRPHSAGGAEDAMA